MSNDHRSAEEHARQVLLMCARAESFRAAGGLDRDEQDNGPEQTENSTVDDGGSLGSQLEHMRQALYSAKENASMKYNRLELEHTSLKLEFANTKLELDQANLQLRNDKREKEELRSKLDAAITSKAETVQKLGEANADMVQMLDALKKERDAARKENVRLKKLIARRGFDKSILLRSELSEHGSRGGSCSSTETGSTSSDHDDTFDAQSSPSRLEMQKAGTVGGAEASLMNDKRTGFRSWKGKFASSSSLSPEAKDEGLPPLREVQCIPSARQLLKSVKKDHHNR